MQESGVLRRGIVEESGVSAEDFTCKNDLN